MCKIGQKITRKVDGFMKFFTNMFNPIFDYPPKTLSIAEPSPIKTGGSQGSKAEPKRKPLTRVEPKAGSTLEVVPKPQTLKIAKEPVQSKPEEPKQKEKIICPVQSKEVQRPEASFKVNKPDDKKIEKKGKEMNEKRKSHDEYCHDDKYYCPPFPEVPVTSKGFEWCDYHYYKDDIEKFIDYIKEYQCKYPCVLLKYKKIYVSKCKVQIYVYFALCEYEKAWEIEKKLQEKYIKMKMHHHYDEH